MGQGTMADREGIRTYGVVRYLLDFEYKPVRHPEIAVIGSHMRRSPRWEDTGFGDTWVFADVYTSYMRQGWQLTFHRRIPGGMFSGWYLISPDFRWAKVHGGGGLPAYPRQFHVRPLRIADWIVTHGWTDDWDVHADHGLLSVSPGLAW